MAANYLTRPTGQWWMQQDQLGQDQGDDPRPSPGGNPSGAAMSQYVQGGTLTPQFDPMAERRRLDAETNAKQDRELAMQREREENQRVEERHRVDMQARQQSLAPPSPPGTNGTPPWAGGGASPASAMTAMGFQQAPPPPNALQGQLGGLISQLQGTISNQPQVQMPTMPGELQFSTQPGQVGFQDRPGALQFSPGQADLQFGDMPGHVINALRQQLSSGAGTNSFNGQNRPAQQGDKGNASSLPPGVTPGWGYGMDPQAPPPPPSGGVGGNVFNGSNRPPQQADMMDVTGGPNTPISGQTNKMSDISGGANNPFTFKSGGSNTPLSDISGGPNTPFTHNSGGSNTPLSDISGGSNVYNQNPTQNDLPPVPGGQAGTNVQQQGGLASIAAPIAAPIATRGQAFARAKDTSSHVANKAIEALKDQMTSRGLSFSGLEANQGGDILNNAVRFQSQADLDESRKDDDRQWEAAQLGYNGGIQQRGQDISAANAQDQNLLTQRGQDLGWQNAREGNQLTQRGQNLNYQNALANNQLAQRGQDIAWGTSRDNSNLAQRQQDINANNSRDNNLLSQRGQNMNWLTDILHSQLGQQSGNQQILLDLIRQASRT